MAVLLREGNTLTICGRTTRDEFDAWIDYVCETWDAGERTVILDMRTTIPTASWIVGRIARLENFVELDPAPPVESDEALRMGVDPEALVQSVESFMTRLGRWRMTDQPASSHLSVLP
jgi:hypothetical protein